jgi:xanthine/uracil/vitamin C permease (AzgA family)
VLRNSRVDERLVASKEGIGFMELICFLFIHFVICVSKTIPGNSAGNLLRIVSVIFLSSFLTVRAVFS